MAWDAKKIQGPVRKLRKLLKKMSAVPSVQEAHRFRTESRRLEAALPALSLDKQNREVVTEPSPYSCIRRISSAINRDWTQLCSKGRENAK